MSPNRLVTSMRCWRLAPACTSVPVPYPLASPKGRRFHSWDPSPQLSAKTLCTPARPPVTKAARPFSPEASCCATALTRASESLHWKSLPPKMQMSMAPGINVRSRRTASAGDSSAGTRLGSRSAAGRGSSPPSTIQSTKYPIWIRWSFFQSRAVTMVPTSSSENLPFPTINSTFFSSSVAIMSSLGRYLRKIALILSPCTAMPAGQCVPGKTAMLP
mmetsp:Transcript_9062/g.25308  ORF Transcript_9062/g.25308 Transcript_9062/m.25308 type:complete len:217 (+) Transcript_9062:433-1083(+)